MTAHGSPDRVPLDALLAHRDWVRALARRLVIDPNDAADVEQETWRMAVERPPRHAESLRAWLAAVVRNAARGSGRRASRRLRHEAAAISRREVPSPEDLVAAAELQTRLARAVLELDEPYRSTVLYRFHEGLESSEIAARLGVPVETVRTRLKRAIERLRERMGVEVGDDRDAWCLLLVGARGSGGNGSGTFLPLPSSSSAATAAVAGGVAMAIGMKTIAAAAVAAAGVAWWLWPGDGPPAPRADVATSPPVAPATETAPRREPRPRAESAPSAPETETAAAATTDASEGDVVRGRVIDDETGRPVAKVTVSLVSERARRPGKERSAVTSDDGAFRIAGAVEGRFGDLLLQADGYAESIQSVPWREPGSGLAKFDAGDVRIYRGQRVAGRVIAADRRSGVSGARICLSRAGASTSNLWFNQAKEMGRSGADGAFVLERVPPSLAAPYTLFAVDETGVGWTTLPAAAGRAEALGVEVTLRPVGAATVTVTDSNGVPQSGARVVASPRFEPLGPPTYWDAGHDASLPEGTGFDAIFGAKTDAAGVARMTTLPTGDEDSAYEFIAYGKGTGWSECVAITAGETVEVTIEIAAPTKQALVAGVRVTDAEGRAIEGATVTVVSGPAGVQATTGPDGVAILKRMEDFRGEGVLGWFQVAKEGFAKQGVGVKLVPDDGSPLQTLVLQRPTPIDGRVVDQDGRPVAGCSVDLIRDGDSIPSLTTGADGKFSFPDATAGAWTLRHNAPQPYDAWEQGSHESAVEGGDRSVVVVLRRLPVGKARVVATIVDADTGAALSPQEAMLIPAERSADPIRVPDAKTDFGAGTVTIPRMRPGRYRLWVRVPGRVAAVADVEVRAEDADVAVRVVVGKPGKLRGRVEMGDSGIDAPPMVVLGFPDDWTRPEWASYRTATMIGAEKVSADGAFVFEGLPPGRYRAWIDWKGFLGEGFADVPAGGEGTAVVTFVRAAVVSFRLAAASVSDRVRVDVSQGDGPWSCVVSSSGDKGRATVHDCTLRPGTYRWRATFPADPFESARTAAESAEGEVTVVAGETVVVEVPVVAK